MTQDFWVFGYGSLLWNPGFEPELARPAVLHGYKRSFCMWSVHHRGTKASPGLVLALDRSNLDSCRGMVLKVAADATEEVLADLRRRELISYAYKETEVSLTLLDGGGTVAALAYVIDRNHHQYSHMNTERQAQIIARASGGRGKNSDYLERTVSKLDELGIGDPDLDSLLQRVRQINSSSEP